MAVLRIANDRDIFITIVKNWHCLYKINNLHFNSLVKAQFYYTMRSSVMQP